MTENDKPSDVSTTRLLLEIDTDGEGDDDIHFCKRCRLMFTSLQDYLDHKVQHDKYKVSFTRNGKNRKLIIPKLIQPEDIKHEPGKANEITDNTEQEIHKKKRGRKRKSEEVLKEQVPEENNIYNTSYTCIKCDLKFNREAALKRHIAFVHDEETVEDSDEDKIDEDYQEEEEDEEDEEKRQPRSPKQYNIIKNSDGGDRPYECHICHNRFKEISILKTHMLTHSDNRDFPCSIQGCTYAFKTKGALKRHLRRHTGERPYSCEACGRSFTESGALTRHMRSRVPCTNKSDSDLPRYKMKWNLPNQTIHQIGETDIQEVDEESSVVQISDLVAAALNSDTLHTNADGSIQVVISADQNDIRLTGLDGSSDEVVVINLGNAEQEETISSTHCQVCEEQLPTIYQLKEHLRKHITDHANRCKICHFISEDQEQLIKHYTAHHPEESDDILAVPFKEEGAKDALKQLLELPDDDEENDKLTQKCPVCLKPFRGTSYLKLHMKSHIGEKAHKCTVCEKSFITKDTLNKHMSVHNTERQYKCGECGKLFKRISHVREHLKIHSVDRPFPCSVCSKSFKSANAMRVHMRTHTSILPYECKFCHRKFREKASLLRHVRMHTGERPFKCNRCGRAFAEHGTLNRHLKAKVPCTGHSLPIQQDQTDYNATVLSEFSSVVADTQQYIMSDTTEQQVEEATEYVVVQTGSDDYQNVEIITEEEVIDGMEVSRDYILLNEEGGNVRIVDSKTGETIATMPASALTDSSSSGEIIATIPPNYTEVEESVSDDQIAQSLIQAIEEGNTIVENVQVTEMQIVEHNEDQVSN
ncbi:uncharacterized protein LOC143045462 [Mytilus galloprovincialis]|uniref:uncharacterized protein LOC143045462 n=1 Tax=Mytilus galloprovincialis TaxID=29158 RepID=UPI003F7C190B